MRPRATAAGKVGDRVRGCMLFCCFKLGINFFFWRAVALYITFHSCADLVCLRAAIFLCFREILDTLNEMINKYIG